MLSHNFEVKNEERTEKLSGAETCFSFSCMEFKLFYTPPTVKSWYLFICLFSKTAYYHFVPVKSETLRILYLVLFALLSFH